LLRYYAEYLVARELTKKGHNVELRKTTFSTPDLIIKDIGKTVEVKSSMIDNEYWGCGASFGNGKSISENKFNYSVFVVFKNYSPYKFFIFTLEELRELLNKKVGVFKNNPYALIWYETYEEYLREYPDAKDRLKLEINLHKHPEEYEDRWDRIK